jgi:peptide-methionine (S)-S-oxide reductase
MRSKSTNVTEAEALKGRSEPLVVTRPHLVLGASMVPPFAPELETAFFALGCFWGAERIFFTLPGVAVTAVGYQGGYTPNPTYHEVCTGRTGHTETVEVVFDPTVVSYAQLVKVFFESHDPTQGNRQGADVGSQYRSAIFTTSDAQLRTAEQAAESYAERLRADGYGPVTTEIAPAGAFYMAEEYHQQYLIANPNGYCGIGGTGVSCPIGLETN